MIDGYDSSVRSRQDLAGIFEYDGDTGVFYLWNDVKIVGNNIIGYIKVINGKTDIEMNDISIQWNSPEEIVAIFVRNKLCALFDCLKMKPHGGLYNEEKDDSDLRKMFGLVN